MPAQADVMGRRKSVSERRAASRHDLSPGHTALPKGAIFSCIRSLPWPTPIEHLEEREYGGAIPRSAKNTARDKGFCYVDFKETLKNPHLDTVTEQPVVE